MTASGDSVQPFAAAAMFELIVITASAVMCCRCGESIYSSAAVPEAELPFPV